MMAKSMANEGLRPWPVLSCSAVVVILLMYEEIRVFLLFMCTDSSWTRRVVSTLMSL